MCRIKPINPMGPHMTTPTATPTAAYVQLLQSHDWHYEFSDDHAVWCRGRDQRAALSKVQRELDADFAIWNQHAPESCRVGVTA